MCIGLGGMVSVFSELDYESLREGGGGKVHTVKKFREKLSAIEMKDRYCSIETLNASHITSIVLLTSVCFQSL